MSQGASRACARVHAGAPLHCLHNPQDPRAQRSARAERRVNSHQLEIPVHNSLAVHELYRRHDLRKEAAPVSLREVPVREHSDEELSMGSELHKDVVIPPNHLEPA
eukprot:scaffold23597_cov29-Tisochrysis_lutea.AAC.4